MDPNPTTTAPESGFRTVEKRAWAAVPRFRQGDKRVRMKGGGRAHLSGQVIADVLARRRCYVQNR
ncbi:hypothetical protein GCM10020216_060530 [Nonomuraea helvata]